MSTDTNHDSVNPFASPRIIETAPVKDRSAAVTGRRRLRLSEASLKWINRFCCIADCAFLPTVITLVLWLNPRYYESIGLQQYDAFKLHAVCCFALWSATVAISFRANSFSDLLVAFFVIPIPFFGLIAFFMVRVGIVEKMVPNGWRPQLIGFSEDREQCLAMAGDPNYSPSLDFEIDGSKRKHFYSFTEISFLTIIFGGLAATFLLPLLGG